MDGSDERRLAIGRSIPWKIGRFPASPRTFGLLFPRPGQKKKFHSKWRIQRLHNCTRVHLCSCHHLTPSPTTPFISPASLPLMSLRRSERIAATASTPTQEPARQTGTRIRKQPVRQSTGGRGPLRFEPQAHHPRLRSSVNRPRPDAEDSTNANQEGDGVDGSIDDSDGSITNPTKVKQPFISQVNPALSLAWRVNPKHDMCFIFDSTSPARRFKRGMVFNEDADFPTDTHDGNITETDGPGPGWMPVDPGIVRCVLKHFIPHR